MIRKFIKNSILIISIVTLCGAFFFAGEVYATDNPFLKQFEGEDSVASKLDKSITNQTSPYEFLIRIVNFAVGFIGIGTAGMFVYAGVLYMTSGGKEEKVTKAKKYLMNGTVGGALVVVAYGIVMRTLTGGGFIISAEVGRQVRTVVRLIRIGLGLVGTVSLIVLLWSGVKWMTAGGNDQQVQDAKKTIRNAIIGLIVITMAYSVTSWVILRLSRATRSYGGSAGLDIGTQADSGFVSSPGLEKAEQTLDSGGGFFGRFLTGDD
jgi:hypothetical protein